MWGIGGDRGFGGGNLSAGGAYEIKRKKWMAGRGCGRLKSGMEMTRDRWEMILRGRERETWVYGVGQ